MKQTVQPPQLAPFEDLPQLELYYRSSGAEKVLQDVQTWSAPTGGVFCVFGVAGSGKTMTARQVIARFPVPERCTLLTARAGEDTAFHEALFRGIGVASSSEVKSMRGLLRVRQALRQRAKDRGSFLVVIDQAEHLSAMTIETLAALTRRDGSGVQGVSLLLFGRSEAQSLLCDDGRPLRARINGVVTLAPLSREETGAYIAHRLRVAGVAGRFERFDVAAIDRVYEISRGLPRRINRLCAAGLAAADQQESGAVTATVIDAVARALSAPAPGDPANPAPESGGGSETVLLAESTRPRGEIERSSGQDTGIGADLSAEAEDFRDDPRPDLATAGSGTSTPDTGRPEYSTRVRPAILRGRASTGHQEGSPSVDALIANGEALLTRLEESLGPDATPPRSAQGYAPVVEARLLEHLTRAERLLQRLGEAGDRVMRTIDEAEAQATKAATAYQSTARLMVARTESAQSLSKHLTTQIERADALTRETRETERRLTQLQENLTESERAVRQRTTETTTAVESGRELVMRLQALLQQVETREELLAKQAADQAQRLDQNRAQTQATVTELQRTMKDGQDLAAGLEALLQRSVPLQRELPERITRAEESLSAIERQARRWEQIEKASERQVGKCRTALQALFSQAERERRQIKDILATGDGLQETLAESNRTARENLQSADAAATRIRQTLDAAETRIRDSVNAAVKEVQQSLESAQFKTRTIEQASARAERANEAIETTSASGEALHARLTETAQKLAAADQQTTDRLFLLGAACERAESGISRLDAAGATIESLAATSEELSTRIRAEATTAERREQALASHVAAARQIISELSDLHRVSREDVAAWQSARTESEATRTHVQSLIGDLRALTEASDSQRDTLNDHRKELDALIESLSAQQADAAQRRDALAESNTNAKQTLEALRAAGAGAGTLTERLSNITQALQSGTTVRDALTGLIEQGTSVQRSAEAAVQDLAANAERVRNEQAEARIALGEHRQVLEHAQSAADRLDAATRQAQERMTQVAQGTHDAEQTAQRLREAAECGRLVVTRAEDLLAAIEDRERSAESGERILREFVAQAQKLAESLKDLHARTGQIERQVADLCLEPQTLVKDARQQAEQLDKVCKAVQKVFAGLSKVSLEANQRIEEFRKTSREADTRLERLAHDTDEAARTLKEWVEEAIRGQSRLAATLAKTPGIGSTHPTQTLQRLVAPEAGRIVSAPASRFPRPPQPADSDVETPVAAAESEKPRKPRSRAEQISELLREAQEATGSAAGV